MVRIRTTSSAKYGSFLNILPSYDILVGEGREGLTKKQAEYCARPGAGRPGLAAELRVRASSSSSGSSAGIPPGYENIQAQIAWLKELIHNGGRQEEMGRYGGEAQLIRDQVQFFRDFRLMCMPRFEKTYKTFDADNFALSKAGTYFTVPSAPTAMNERSVQVAAARQSLFGIPWLRGIVRQDRGKRMFSLIGEAEADDTMKKIIWPWPLGWRGYSSETAAQHWQTQFMTPQQWADAGWAKGFPFLNQNDWPYDWNEEPPFAEADLNTDYNCSEQSTCSDLDFTQRGDIIVLNYASPSGNFTRTYFVTKTGNFPEHATIPCPIATNLPDDRCPPDWLDVVGWNNGKFPSSVGITDQIGAGPEFRMFRSQVHAFTTIIGDNNQPVTGDIHTLLGMAGGNVLSDDSEELDAITPVTLDNGNEENEPSCVDAGYTSCSVPQDVWDNALVFRPGLIYPPSAQNDDTPTNDVFACPAPAELANVSLADAYNTFCQGQPTAQPFSSILLSDAWLDTYAVNGFTAPRYSDPQAGTTYIPHAYTQCFPASLFSFCANAGYDPPFQWRKEGTAGDFGGAGGGQITLTTPCPPGPATDEEGVPLGSGDGSSWGGCKLVNNPNGPDQMDIVLPTLPQPAR